MSLHCVLDGAGGGDGGCGDGRGDGEGFDSGEGGGRGGEEGEDCGGEGCTGMDGGGVPQGASGSTNPDMMKLRPLWPAGHSPNNKSGNDSRLISKLLLSGLPPWLDSIEGQPGEDSFGLRYDHAC